MTLRYLEAVVRIDVSGQFKGKSYLVSKSIDLKFVDADASCVEYGGFLAELDDQSVYDFVMGFVRSLGADTFYYVGVNLMISTGRATMCSITASKQSPLTIGPVASGTTTVTRTAWHSVLTDMGILMSVATTIRRAALVQ